mmetsp:Transcript_3308/g.10863  ORF Transcript_3308/g.10863 Transcript_3308/m.10863 type:complete len:279 (+) Transcript_3308:59-895(+)
MYYCRYSGKSDGHDEVGCVARPGTVDSVGVGCWRVGCWLTVAVGRVRRNACRLCTAWRYSYARCVVRTPRNVRQDCRTLHTAPVGWRVVCVAKAIIGKPPFASGADGSRKVSAAVHGAEASVPSTPRGGRRRKLRNGVVARVLGASVEDAKATAGHADVNVLGTKVVATVGNLDDYCLVGKRSVGSKLELETLAALDKVGGAKGVPLPVEGERLLVRAHVGGTTGGTGRRGGWIGDRAVVGAGDDGAASRLCICCPCTGRFATVPVASCAECLGGKGC